MGNVFRFFPMEFVKINVFDLRYHGRVLRCIWDGPGSLIYQVQYVDDKGDLQSNEFFEDELVKSISE